MRRDTDTTHWNKAGPTGKETEREKAGGFENFVDSIDSFPSSPEVGPQPKIPNPPASRDPADVYAFGGPEEPIKQKPIVSARKEDVGRATSETTKPAEKQKTMRQRSPIKAFHQKADEHEEKKEVRKEFVDANDVPGSGPEAMERQTESRPAISQGEIEPEIQGKIKHPEVEPQVKSAPQEDLDLTLDPLFHEAMEEAAEQIRKRNQDTSRNPKQETAEGVQRIDEAEVIPAETKSQLPARLEKRNPEEDETSSTDVTRPESPVSSGGRSGGGRLGDRLIAKGLITEDQLSVALQEKKLSGKMLGQVLVDLDFITEGQLSEILAEAAGFEVFDAKNTIVDGDALALLPKDMAMKLQVLPVSLSGQTITLAMADPHDVVAMDKLRRHLPKNLIIKPLVTTPSVLGEAIDAAYGYSSDVAAILTEMENLTTEDLTKIPENEAYTHPVVRLVNALVFEAVKMGVSDLHWEPEENFIRLRYRLDGVLFTTQIIHKKHWSPISQRIKIMANMNIADKLTPQDGRFELKVGARSADFRVSSLPTVWGENIVMRVLDKTASILPLEKLGFSPGNLEKIKFSQARPEGIIIVTGPTGSGKSTSLYSMINAINNVEVNIQTLEDPVEYSLPMIRQTPVREGSLEFADGIRAMLRQDPDIIFIGEIRDGVTAEMALKAAMTGHQVYTTLHTNDSFSAIPRLIDLGLKPGMIAGAVIAIFAQRLARRLCPNCRVAYQPEADECKHLGGDPASPPTIYKPKQGGCGQCRGQGYRGRIALAEILTLDEELDEIIARGGSKVELRRRAVEKGFKSMKDDAILKILDGTTSFESAKSCVDFSR